MSARPVGDRPVPPNDQEQVSRRYDRVARFYDLYSGPMESMGVGSKRRRLVGRARGFVLEAGIGTGRNLEHYPPEARVLGIDISPRMLDRARRRAARLGRDSRLEVGNVERLPFEEESFDTVVATCLFCSVPDPVQGLRELGRVARPGGEILLLEHVRPRGPFFGRIADILSPITRRLFGFNLNRRTEDNLTAAGLEIAQIRRSGIWREIVARPSHARGAFPSSVRSERQDPARAAPLGP